VIDSACATEPVSTPRRAVAVSKANVAADSSARNPPSTAFPFLFLVLYPPYPGGTPKARLEGSAPNAAARKRQGIGFLPAGGTIPITVQHSARASMMPVGHVRHHTPPDFRPEQTGSMLRIEASCVG
jgi:hypothetical protein